MHQRTAASYLEGGAFLLSASKDERVAIDFDTLARSYDAWYHTPVGAWADHIETEALFRLLQLQAGEHLLDLGTGTARMALEIARQGVHVTGLDGSPEMLQVAQSRLQHHQAEHAVRLIRGDMQTLPFPDQSFDAVLTVTTLCFVASPDRVIDESARVLRPGGRLVIGELNRWSLWTLLRRIEGLVRPTLFQSAHFLDIWSLRRFTHQSRLHMQQWHGMLHLPPVNSHAFLHQLEPIEHAAQRWVPAFGAFLVLEATRPY